MKKRDVPLLFLPAVVGLFLLILLFPPFFHRIVMHSAEEVMSEGVLRGKTLYGERKRQELGSDMITWIGILEDFNGDSLYGGLPEEERKLLIIEKVREGTLPFLVRDREGRTYGLSPEDPPLPVTDVAPEGTLVLWGDRDLFLQPYGRWGWTLGVYTAGRESYLEEFISLYRSVLSIVFVGSERKVTLLFYVIAVMFLVVFLYLYSLLLENIKKDRELTHYYEALDESLCLMVTDSRGLITRVNRNYEKLSGYGEAELLNNPHYINHHPDFVAQQREAMGKSLQRTHKWRGLLRGINAKGQPFWIQTLIGEMRNSRNELEGYLAVAQDVSEIHSQRKQLEIASMTDPLTGYWNRIKLIQDMDGNPRSYVACFNIDGFSNINKLFGFGAGDRLLQEVGDRLHRTLIPEKETLYRLNGDNFVIRGEDLGEELFIEGNIRRQAGLNPLSVSDASIPYSITLRMGIATCPQDTYLLGDSALKGAKSDSRGYRIIRTVQDEREMPGIKQIEQLNTIRAALQNDRLSLVFQPIADTMSGEIVKYECLLRVRDDEGMVINPSELIEVAKKGRLYKQITHFVIDEVMKACEKSRMDFSVNFTLEDFLDRETVEYLVSQAAMRNVADRIILEIVETEELSDYEGMEEIFRELKALGFRIAIDDFGSGFSNFTYLLKLNVDYIKIDGSLIRNILTDEKTQSLVVSIILFAVESGFKTIAEYIESPDILERIRSLGVDFAQGYHIGKPGELPL